ncbi:D-methionine transport system substrate-binding protein [Gracilibacillus orientalis]|uniref:Lipoprotein n=1 Tax=Gracilibacillus orientalis TaxID=334253 RepID=A0A1I4K2G1_9BACI|nr:MetQ/NlpA family ABC transporter substrate-binding protein [Gracilibacillus orientalis]SFL72950.1 D-methionine transport system substrate-binding protein [Gracilibacillus orientalis]
MKKLVGLISVAIILILAACGNNNADSNGKLDVGVTAGPHEDIVNHVKELAAEEGLDIEVHVFNDYVMPNTALDEGELDANIFQHEPFMNNARDEGELDLVKVADTVNFPMGIYSDQYSSLDELQEGDKVGLPNHSSGEPRALMLFEEAGLITLPEDAGVDVTVKDIQENPLNLEFVLLEASQIPRQLGEVQIAAINTNYALESGRVPTEDSLHMEPKESPWVNVLATREENVEDENIQQLIDIYRSEEVKQFIEENFADSVITSW